MIAHRSLIALFSIFALNAVSLLAADAPKLPPAEAGAKERIEKSPRHGEYVDVPIQTGKPIKSYVVYPEVKDKAPVVIVIHEIFGLSDWVKSVADQLAADGFIAIAPDLLSGMGDGGKGTDGFKDRQAVIGAIRGLKADQVVAQLNAIRDYGMKRIPASNGKTATIGFCWGGGQSFAYAVAQPELNAAVVYYGTNPNPGDVEKVKAAVMGNYGGNDQRVNATVPAAQEAAKKAGKTYEVHTYEGAGHGFLRQQDGGDANKKAAEEAWPATIKFLREHTK